MTTASASTRLWRCLLASLTLASPAVAQQQQGAYPQQREARDEAIDRLAGTYRAENHALHIAEVRSPGLQRPMYVEMVERGREADPIRQHLWVFYPQESGLHMRAFRFPPTEFKRGARNLADLAIGIWAAPRYFPEIQAGRYRAIADLTVELDQQRLSLRSEALSVKLAEETLEWTDQGLDDQAPLSLTRAEPDVEVSRTEDGLVMIDLREGKGPPAAAGDSAMIDYTAWTSRGVLFDSTELPGRRYVITALPWETIEGLRDGVMGMRAPPRAEPGEGGVRRLLIPSSHGFGSIESRPKHVPPNASLIYNIHLRTLKDNTPEEEDAAR